LNGGRDGRTPFDEEISYRAQCPHGAEEMVAAPVKLRNSIAEKRSACD
jgi:hypothetical protein